MKNRDRKAVAVAIMKENGGIASIAMLRSAGLTRTDIYRLRESGDITSIRRGYYSPVGYHAADEAIIARMLPEAVVNGGSALYHYGYSDYTPRKWVLAVPRDISRSRLEGIGIPKEIHYDSYYSLGIAEDDFNGVRLLVYDRERIICDCIKHRSRIDNETFVKALHAYAADEKKDLRKLSDYAGRLGISEKVRSIMEIVLNA